MAARAPSEATEYIDTSVIVARKPAIETQYDEAVTDQQFSLDIESPLIMDCFHPFELAAAGPTYYCGYRFLGRNMCGIASSEDCEWGSYAWCDAGVTFSIYVHHIGTAQVRTLAVAASVTSEIWRGWASASKLNCYTDGSVNEIEIGLERTSGSGSVYLAGFVLRSA